MCCQGRLIASMGSGYDGVVLVAEELVLQRFHGRNRCIIVCHCKAVQQEPESLDMQLTRGVKKATMRIAVILRKLSMQE